MHIYIVSLIYIYINVYKSEQVGYQLVLFSQLLGAAGSMYGIFEQYKRLTGNATRFVELLEELDKISGQKRPRLVSLL
jgi:hypothetical protein